MAKVRAFNQVVPDFGKLATKTSFSFASKCFLKLVHSFNINCWAPKVLK